jgi:hypothetical protein
LCGSGLGEAHGRTTTSGTHRPPGPTFFFVLGLVYLALLLLLAIGREARFWFLDDLHDPIAGVLPLGVPWFGALGAVTLSLYGVFDHNDHWDRNSSASSSPSSPTSSSSHSLPRPG